MPEILPVAWQSDAPLPAASLDALQRAVDVLRGGGLVAIPTETVYGLAAVAIDPDAVARIFTAKGRPSSNPLIVHVADADAAEPLVAAWPETAAQAATRHWPGPLTMVLPASTVVPAVVRAGGPTVAVRCPAHPITANLLRLLGQPLAAPSANRSGMISPTTAAHVAASLGEAVDLILDGGTCDCGIESTVLDLSVSPPRILRPGPIDRSTLELSLSCPVEGPGSDANVAGRSPGLLPRHYAPRATLHVLHDGQQFVRERLEQGERVGWITRGKLANTGSTTFASKRLQHINLPNDPAGYAHALYATLHRLDDAGADAIVVEAPPSGDAWQAVTDRLTRASKRD